MYPHLLQILGYSVVALAEPHCKTKNKHSVTDVKEKSDVVVEVKRKGGGWPESKPSQCVVYKTWAPGLNRQTDGLTNLTNEERRVNNSGCFLR